MSGQSAPGGGSSESPVKARAHSRPSHGLKLFHGWRRPMRLTTASAPSAAATPRHWFSVPVSPSSVTIQQLVIGCYVRFFLYCNARNKIACTLSRATLYQPDCKDDNIFTILNRMPALTYCLLR